MADKPRVARYQADRTNQKFYFCRLACVEADKAVDKQQYQAYCETAIFHLHGAYLAFLQELAHFYNLDTTSPSLTSIETGLASKTLVSPEIERLKQSKEQGILANVLNAFKRCQYAPTPEQGLTTEPSADLIVNVVTMSNQWLPDEQTIREWRQLMMTMVDEMRGGMVEY